MIGKLTGRLDAVSLHAVIVDVGGVGYEVTVGARTLTSLPPLGAAYPPEKGTKGNFHL